MRSTPLGWPKLLAVVAFLAILHSTDSTALEFTSHLVVSLASNGTSFIASAKELPRDLLMTQFTDKKVTKTKTKKSIDSNEMVQDDLAMCSQNPQGVYHGQIDVLLLFSKCVENSTLVTIETWARDMKRIVADTVDKNSGVALNFQATLVRGQCSDAAHGDSEVTADDLDRVAAFQGFGDVYQLDSATRSTDSYTAAITFATDGISYNAIINFENMNQIASVVNFQMYGSGDNCEGGPESCIELKHADDIFMYNPFTVTQSLDCADLENGVPVALIDDNGTRQCCCGCPAGFEMQIMGRDKACVKVGNSASTCVWSKVSGYKHQVDSQLSICSFDHIVDKWGFPLPLPTSGYSSNKRLLADGSLDPRVRVSAVKIQNPEYYAGYLTPILGTVTSSWPMRFKDVVARAPNAATFDPMVPGHDTIGSPWRSTHTRRREDVERLPVKPGRSSEQHRLQRLREIPTGNVRVRLLYQRYMCWMPCHPGQVSAPRYNSMPS
ncbi:hypothetical protein F443_21677 [Phytophthora nicotianae P1569]|uniref:Uncharacterized protein n=2 Tax=Phytophthora nicotianae TaxID=4792 RepID=V9DWR9_PHYNI|nr:hypothetical protein F443_21677 [Phytophthora nicotianae P1569]